MIPLRSRVVVALLCSLPGAASFSCGTAPGTLRPNEPSVPGSASGSAQLSRPSPAEQAASRARALRDRGVLDRSAALYAEAFALDARPEWGLARAQALAEGWAFAEASAVYASLLAQAKLPSEVRARAEAGLAEAKARGAEPDAKPSDDHLQKVGASIQALLDAGRRADARTMLEKETSASRSIPEWFDDLAVLAWLDGDSVRAQQNWARGRRAALSRGDEPAALELMPPLGIATRALAVAEGLVAVATIEPGLVLYDYRRNRFRGLPESVEQPHQVIAGAGASWVTRDAETVHAEPLSGLSFFQAHFASMDEAGTEKLTSLASSSDQKWFGIGASDGGVHFVLADRHDPTMALTPLSERSPIRKLGAVRAIAFDSRSERAAVAHAKGVIRILTLKGKEIGRLTAGTASVEALSFAPDGSRLFSGSADGQLRLWDVGSRKELASLRHPEPIHYVRAVGPAEVDFASRLSVFRTGLPATGEPKDLVTGDAGGYDVLAVSDSPDGKLRATSHYKSDTVHVWDAKTGTEKGRVRAANDEVADIDRSPDGRWFAAATSAGVHVIDLATLAATRFDFESAHGVAFSPDGRTLAVAGFGGYVLLWDVAAKREKRRIVLEGKGYPIDELQFSPDGFYIGLSVLGTAALYEVSSGRRTDRFTDVASFDWEGKVLAVTDHERSALGGASEIRLLESGRAGRPLFSVEGSAPLDLTESGWLAGHQKGDTVVWDAKGNERFRKREPDQGLFALSPSGELLAICYDGGRLEVFDVPSRTLLFAHQAHSGLFRITDAMWVAKGKILVTAGHDGIKFWDPSKKPGERDARSLLATMRLTSDGWFLVTHPPAGKGGSSQTAGFSRAIVSDVREGDLSGGFSWEALRDDRILSRLFDCGQPTCGAR